ncbi:hypothetical protein BH24DEI2_BH24DEI2_04540 [soil metagenome]
MAHPKNELIDRAQRARLGKPKYKTNNVGPEHDALFVSEVFLSDELIGRGEGKQKRDAERQAAQAGLAYLDNTDELEVPDMLDEAEEDSVLSSAAELPFDGPWPLFPDLLATTLTIANGRVEAGSSGATAVAEVRDLAVELYKSVLESLGEVVEVDEE